MGYWIPVSSWMGDRLAELSVCWPAIGSFWQW